MKLHHALASGLLLGIILSLSTQLVWADDPVSAALGQIDITPDVTRREKPVFIAGYGSNRRATGVHDKIFARGVVLTSGNQKIALVSVDLVGLQYPTVQAIRRRLSDYAYVMVASTHNHEGPDVVGIWGPSPFTSGVDPDYLKLVSDRIVQLVRRIEAKTVPVQPVYGTAKDESLLRDARLPKVYDGVLRILRFNPVKSKDAKSKKPVGILVQWNCHPESMGSKNTLLTADFPATTVATLAKKYDCPVAFFSGAVGGLMTPPRDNIKNAKGEILREGQFEFAQQYGRQVANLASKAVEAAKPIKLAPFVVSAKSIAIPLDNPLYKAAKVLGVLNRTGRVWTGDPEKLGKIVSKKSTDVRIGIETEVAYLRLGELHVACIPGEIYPELVYGGFQDPVEPGADFPKAPLEKSVTSILPGKKFLLFGLANDEIGYIIPKRQWDQKPPFCYQRKKSQYGEINSCGSEVAPLLMQVLQNRVRDAAKK